VNHFYLHTERLSRRSEWSLFKSPRSAASSILRGILEALGLTATNACQCDLYLPLRPPAEITPNALKTSGSDGCTLNKRVSHEERPNSGTKSYEPLETDSLVGLNDSFLDRTN
jgi:hypothetical protein